MIGDLFDFFYCLLQMQNQIRLFGQQFDVQTGTTTQCNDTHGAIDLHLRSMFGQCNMVF